MSRSVLLVSALLLCAFGTVCLACEPSGQPEMRLEVTAAEFASAQHSDRTLIVEIHDNRCAAVKRPQFWREAGTYAVAVSPALHDSLAAQASALVSGKASSATLKAEIQRLRERRAKDGSLEVFEVSDADQYSLLIWRNGAPQRLDVESAKQWAEAFPGSAPLTAFDALREALQQLATDPAAVALRAAPSILAEVQP